MSIGVVERVWYGSDPLASAARVALWPLAGLFGFASRMRGRLYDSGAIEVRRAVLPTISIGNLTVGGTGKTPFAAWLAGRLSVSAIPAIALRGYGTDEIEVHRRLNPHIPIVVDSDRVAAIRAARSRDAEVVVLDDAFQHRRVARSADIVLLSAEQLLRPRRLLPAGPWREPLSAAGRSDLLVITRKAATAADVERAIDIVRDAVPGVAISVVGLRPLALGNLESNESRPLTWLGGASVLAIAAIGEPSVFARQLEQLGARVSLAAYRDHHVFTDDEAQALAARVPSDGFAVCTLKDAAKLSGRWPGSSRLWYVSQQLVVEQGAEEIDRLIERVLAARATTTITAG